MSVTLEAYVEVRNKYGWEEIIPIVRGKEVWFWEPNATYDIFEILREHGQAFAPKIADEHDLSSRVAEEAKVSLEGGACDFRVWNLADMMIYYYQNPKVKDYDAEWDDETNELPEKENPIKDIIDKVKFYYTELADGWWDGTYSDARLVYWFA